MPVRDVLLYPNPVLKQRAAEVTEVNADARAVAQDLLDTMRASGHSVGIAANQIGSLIRCVVVDVTGHRKAVSCHGEIVLFNPRIEQTDGAEVGREGCMSIPDLTANVRRPTSAVVSGLDFDGRATVIRADAFEARALLHEIDHLDGILFLDRVASLDTDVFRRRT